LIPATTRLLSRAGVVLKLSRHIVEHSTCSARSLQGEINMEGPARGCLAGLISWKLGGGFISTIIIFLLVFWLLGYVRC
jgi:hypothetical protein